MGRTLLTALPSQVKRVVVYLGRDKTMQLLEELMCELELTDPVSSAVTHMDNPPYYRITSSYKIPSVTSGIYDQIMDIFISCLYRVLYA